MKEKEIMHRQWLVGLLCLVLLGACQEEPDPEENETALPELATERVFSVDLDEDGPRRQLTVAGDGGFYMANRFTYEVYEFSPLGEVQRRVGSEGEGPGEFSQPLEQVVVVGGRVFASGSFTDRSINVFDENLMFKESIDVGGQFFGMSAYGDELLAAVLNTDTGRLEIKRYTVEGFETFQLLSQQRSIRDDPSAIFRNVGFLASDATLIAYAYIMENAIELFDTSGDEVRRVTAQLPVRDVEVEWEDNLPEGVPRNLRNDIPTATMTRGVAVDQGHAFVLGGSADSTLEHTVFVFRADGTPVATIPLDVAGDGGNAFDVSDGHLYYRTAEGQLRMLWVDLEPLGIENPERRWTACGVTMRNCFQRALDEGGEEMQQQVQACREAYCDCAGDVSQCQEVAGR